MQKKISAGKTFRGFEGEILERPYLTRNGHLGHYAAEKNPHYFETDQLFDLRTDPQENENFYGEIPGVTQELKAGLSKMLKQFEERPFAEFTR